MARVQIVQMLKGESRWRFVAHGAPYERSDAEAMQERGNARGDKTRFLPLAKGE